MRYRRTDIVTRAVALLDAYGLGDLSMRRLGSELGVQPSALYHHFANKQTLLAAVADEVLRLGARAAPVPDAAWDDVVRHVCGELRDAMLAYRDGAELVATVHAFGLGALEPARRLEATLAAAGFDSSASGVDVALVGDSVILAPAYSDLNLGQVNGVQVKVDVRLRPLRPTNRPLGATCDTAVRTSSPARCRSSTTTVSPT